MFRIRLVRIKRKLSLWIVLAVFCGMYLMKLIRPGTLEVLSNAWTESGIEKRRLLATPFDDECVPGKDAVDEFPKDFFTQEQRLKGGIAVHILIMLYTFGLLAVVCDDYFVISLYHICSRLKLPSDVAGATFMAVGSSAPTLFIAIVSIIFTGSGGDVGLGTVVGSTIFNTLFIIGVCGLAAPRSISVTWYPLFRDSFVYVMGTTALVATIRDRKVHWYEALSFVFIYSFYIFLMIFNKTFMSIAHKIKEKYCGCCRDTEDEYSQSYNDENRPSEREPLRVTPGREPCDVEKDNEKPTSGEKSASILNSHQVPMKQKSQIDGDCPLDFIKTLSTGGNPEKEAIQKDKGTQTPRKESDANATSTPRSAISDSKSRYGGHEDSGTLHDLAQFEHKQQSPLVVPPGFFSKIVWLLEMPVVILFYITIPPCCKARWSDWFLLTFLMSVLWMGVLSYVLVWMVCVIGFTFGIPDCVMGMTFLAAGSSIPDVMASVIVVRQGEGDMALSNAIGSNVFDMLCLGVPWFLKTTVLNPHTFVEIQSKSIMVSALLLLGSIIFVALGIHLNEWKLDSKIGFIFLIVYMVFIALATLVEFIACPCQLQVR